MWKRWSLILVGVLVLALVLPVKAAASYPVTVTDSLGRTVTFASPPQRIVTLTPSLAEMVFNLGAGDRVVGVSAYTDYPREAAGIPVVADALSVNEEALLVADPDLVLGDANVVQKYIPVLDKLGLPGFWIAPSNFSQIERDIQLLGTILAATSRADAVVEEMESRIRAVTTRVHELTRRPRVFVEVWNDPIMAAGPGSFFQTLIDLAGGTNIAADAGAPWPVFSSESVIERNPQMILLTNPYRDEVLAREGWESTDAVKSGRVYEVDPAFFTRPTARLVVGLERLASILHPSAFSSTP